MHKVFIDFTGNHVIITTVAGDCYYLHSSKSKVVNLKRFSDYHIESVAWNRAEGTESSTGVCFMLHGVMHLMGFDHESNDFTKEEMLLKQEDIMTKLGYKC